MKIVSVCACTSGIAHTYIAKEKLIRAAESMGHTIKVETQGTIGTEDELTAEEIKEADVVILAVDIAITGTERFEGKPTIKVPTNVCVKAPKKLIEKIENELGKLREKQKTILKGEENNEKTWSGIKTSRIDGHFLHVTFSRSIRIIDRDR